MGCNLQRHRDLPAFGRELQRVGKQIRDHALDLHPIDVRQALLRQFGREPHARGLSGNLELLHQIIDHLAQIQARFLKYDLTALRLGKQQQRTHDLAQPVDIGAAR